MLLLSLLGLQNTRMAPSLIGSQPISAAPSSPMAVNLGKYLGVCTVYAWPWSRMASLVLSLGPLRHLTPQASQTSQRKPDSSCGGVRRQSVNQVSQATRAYARPRVWGAPLDNGGTGFRAVVHVSISVLSIPPQPRTSTGRLSDRFPKATTLEGSTADTKSICVIFPFGGCYRA